MSKFNPNNNNIEDDDLPPLLYPPHIQTILDDMQMKQVLRALVQNPQNYFRFTADPSSAIAKNLAILVQAKLVTPPKYDIAEMVKKPEIQEIIKEIQTDHNNYDKIMKDPSSEKAKRLQNCVDAGIIRPPAPPEIQELLKDEEFMKVIQEIQKSPIVYYKFLQDPDSENAKKVKKLQEAGYLTVPKKEFAEYFADPEVAQVLEKIKTEENYFYEYMKNDKTPVAQKVLQLIKAGYVKPPPPPEVVSMMKDPEFRLIYDQIEKDASFYFKVINDPESVHAQKLRYLEKIGLFRPPPFPEDFHLLLKAPATQKLLQDLRAKPELFHQYMKNQKSKEAKTCKELLKFGLIKVPPPAEVLELLKDPFVQAECRTIATNPEHYADLLDKPDSPMTKKINLLIAHDLIDPRWIVHEQRLKQLIASDPEVRQSFEQIPLLGFVFKKIIKDPLVLKTFRKKPEVQQVLRVLRDVGLLPNIPPTIWRFDEGLIELLTEMDAQGVAKELVPILQDKEFMEKVRNLMAGKTKLSEIAKNPEDLKRVSFLTGNGILVQIPARSDSHIEINVEKLKDNKEAKALLENYQVREKIGLYCDAPACFAELVDSPISVVEQKVSSLFKMGVLYIEKNYAEYVWVISPPKAVPQSAAEIIKDSNFMGQLILNLNENPDGSKLFSDPELGKKASLLKSVGFLKQVPVYQEWTFTPPDSSNELSKEVSSILNDKEFMGVIQMAQTRPLVIYNFISNPKFKEKAEILQKEKLLTIRKTKMSMTFYFYEPGIRQRKDPELAQLLSDKEFVRQLKRLQEDPNFSGTLSAKDETFDKDDFFTKLSVLTNHDLLEFYYFPYKKKPLNSQNSEGKEGKEEKESKEEQSEEDSQKPSSGLLSYVQGWFQ